MSTLELNDIQAFLRHSYPKFDSAAYCLFSIKDPARTKKWLRTILRVRGDCRFFDSADTRMESIEDDARRVTIAFTVQGLSALGLSQTALDTFLSEFREGMAAPPRARLLGDRDRNAPSEWIWGGREPIDGLLIVFSDRLPNNQSQSPQLLSDAQFARENDPNYCPLLDQRVSAIENMPGCPRFIRRVTGRLRTEPRTGVTREPFDFADGISQPYVEGLTKKDLPDSVSRIKAGEFVLGYRNALDRFPASPSVAPEDGPAHLLPQLAPSGRGDLGRNGTFMVVRELEQNVAAFTTFVNGDQQLAARMVGRWRDGAALIHEDSNVAGLSQRELEAANDFGYHREDPHGFRCPIGAHIRRANPRDSLAAGLGVSPARAREIVDQHRILRRGRAYRKDGADGLMFICLNANLERQFEFVQGSWLMHPQFGGLQSETDPLLGHGPERCLTVQHPLLGECVEGLQQFVTVKGGGYFFLPGLRALNYLSQLP